MEPQEIIEDLKRMDYSSDPAGRVQELLSGFGRFGIIQFTLNRGKILIRARPMHSGEHFSTRSELSYKPAEFNTTYQRASTPRQTMFYGASIPEDLPPAEQANARIIAALETSYLLRTHGQEGEQPITFSKWVVTEDIPLVAICYHANFVNVNAHNRELFEAFHRQTEALDPKMRDRTRTITEFLAEEYAKKDTDPNYKYMISAIFTEIVLRKGMAGVYYPSVRADAQGFNVAISPEYTDRCLRLVAAGECTIYKQGDHTIGDNETICEIDDDSKPFAFQPIAPEHHIGRAGVMAQFALDAKAAGK
jgi:hypothetical protein